MQALICLGLLLWAAAPVAAAEPSGGTEQGVGRHGIAMHGTPKYSADFAHLDYVNPAAPTGGVLRQAVVGSFDNLNPYALRGRGAEGLHLLHDSLMTRVWDEPFSLYGLIAERVILPADRSRITFVLNPAARFHDGRPITTADVLWTFETLRDHGRPNFRANYAQVAAVTVTDARRITFGFADGASRELPLILAMMPVLSQADWQDVDFSRPSLTPPQGSGPYRIAASDPGRRLVLERVADYWARDLPIRRGHHRIDRLVYDYFRDDGVALEAFKAGDIDLRREWDGRAWHQSYDFPAVRDGRVVLAELPHQRPEWARSIIFNTRRPPLDDRALRRALAAAFDFDWVNRVLLHDAFRRNLSVYPNSELAHHGAPPAAERALLDPWRTVLPAAVFEVPFAPLDVRDRRDRLERVVAQLADAGYPIRDRRAVDPETGTPLAFEILITDPGHQRLALSYAAMLDRAGIAVSVRLVDSAQYRARRDAFDFDMIIDRWVSSLSPGAEQAAYWGSATADQRGSRNYAGIRNPAIDALSAGLADARDRAALVTGARALDRALMHGWYAIPLYHLGRDLVAHWAHIRRPAVTPLYGMVLESWWIEGDPPD